MREILFRGKRVDNGEWVYGFYVQDLQGGHLILADEGTWWDGPVLDAIDVIPETVGQYTGMIDKNGRKIFEGDIVTAWSQGHRATAEVKQRIDELWVMYPAYQHGKHWGLGPNRKGATAVEIAGNIHDSPELTEPTE